MKNKKLIVMAVAAAIVLSMQASTVFAGEVSDSDLEKPVAQTTAAAEEKEEAAVSDQDGDSDGDSGEIVTADSTDAADGSDTDEIDVSDADAIDSAEDETAVSDETEEDVDTGDVETVSADESAEEAEDEETTEETDEEAAEETDEQEEDEPTVEDIQALIDGFIADYNENPNTDESQVEETQQILNGLLTEITQSERFTASELTLADVKEYFEDTLDGLEAAYREEVTSGKCGDNLTWEFDEETGTLTIKGSGEMYDLYDEEFDGDWWNAFSFDINKVVFDGEITSISDGALLGLNIETIDIPASVQSISGEAFAINEKLKSINVAAGNENYTDKDGVLFDKNMTELLLYPAARTDASYTVPDTVKKVGNSAFDGCRNITGVVIPDSVTVIDAGAFSDCRHLTDVTVGNSVTAIGAGAFAYCVELDELVLGNSVQNIDYMAFYASGLTKITLPHWLQSVQYGAFAGCSLTDVYYLGTEEEWNELALSELAKDDSDVYPIIHFTPAESYEEPVALEEPEQEAFKLDEETITAIEESIQEFIEELKADEEIDAEQAEEIEGILTDWLDRVKKLGSDDPEIAKSASKDLYELFGDVMQEIFNQFLLETETSGQCGDNLTWSFDKETGLLTITGDGDMYDYYTDPDAEENAAGDIDEDIEDFDAPLTVDDMVKELANDFFLMYDVEDDDDDIFEEDDSGMVPWFTLSGLINGVKLVGNITSISNGAFINCQFPTIDIPASVKSIGESVFADNQKLTSVNVAADNENYSSADGVLFDKAAENLLLYPLGKTDKTYTIPDTVKTIAEYAFEGCRYLTSVVIPDSVIHIGEGAFNNCRQLAEVTIGSAVENIGSAAFMDCYKLKKVTLGSAVESIDEAAFGSSGLTEITIPKSVLFIGSDAFADCDIQDVYYLGTQAEWQQIDFDLGEDIDTADDLVFGNAVIHYRTEEKSDNNTSGSSTDNSGSKGSSDNGSVKKPATVKNQSKPASHKPAKGKNPKTGEESTALPLIALLASALSGAAAFAVSKLRRLKGEEI